MARPHNHRAAAALCAARAGDPEEAAIAFDPARHKGSASRVTQGRSMVASKGSGLPEVAVKARRERGNDDRQNDQTCDREQRKLRLNGRPVTRTHNSL